MFVLKQKKILNINSSLFFSIMAIPLVMMMTCDLPNIIEKFSIPDADATSVRDMSLLYNGDTLTLENLTINDGGLEVGGNADISGNVKASNWRINGDRMGIIGEFDFWVRNDRKIYVTYPNVTDVGNKTIAVSNLESNNVWTPKFIANGNVNIAGELSVPRGKMLNNTNVDVRRGATGVILIDARSWADHVYDLDGKRSYWAWKYIDSYPVGSWTWGWKDGAFKYDSYILYPGYKITMYTDAKGGGSVTHTKENTTNEPIIEQFPVVNAAASMVVEYLK